ncbi:MAG TPA: hypothetical protein VF588_11930 [Pyrinomonadaceae bacterium]
MRKTMALAALMLALCCPVMAGEIPNPPAPQPQGSTVQEPTTDGVTLNGEMPTPPGEMHTPGIIHNPGVSESLAQLGLDLLAVLPSLL